MKTSESDDPTLRSELAYIFYTGLKILFYFTHEGITILIHVFQHGAVVLLYHPCMRGTIDLEELKGIVKGCLRKHLISPYRKLPDSHVSLFFL